MRVNVNVASAPCVICAAPVSPRQDDVCSAECASLLAEDQWARGDFDAPAEAEMCAAALHFAPDE